MPCFVFCATIDVSQIDAPDYIEQVLTHLDENMAQRNNVVARFPDINFIGNHIGSYKIPGSDPLWL